MMAWLGSACRDWNISSGRERRQRNITKTGNSYTRNLLVEAALSYRRPARQFAAEDDGRLMRRPSAMRCPTADISVIHHPRYCCGTVLVP
ncbi:transposase [Paraburkholderia fungorum]|uniref:transposase n=1 Tax=Paraburkholderia fungorum TaxID=134537 RepID=UPI0038BD01C0